MHTVPLPLGVHTLPYRKESLERALQGIAQAGYRVVGLWTDHAGSPIIPLDPTPEQTAALLRLITGFGLTPVTMFARRGAMEQMEPLLADLNLCAALGMPLLQAAGPWPFVNAEKRKGEMRWYGEIERLLRHLAAAVPAAVQRGVTIVLKPHRGATATGADLVDVIERIGSPALRACWDAGNVRFYEGLNSEDDLEQSGVAPLVKSVCIKDQRGGQGVPDFPIPGEGDVDHPRMLHILTAAGFSGPLLIERVDDQPTAEAVDAALTRAHAFLAPLVGGETGGATHAGA
ncbi:MAG: sugar phosphate isomerase/epimerase family protein [Chloroflexota bacterium]